MEKQKEMSAYEYGQANNFIYRLYKQYGRGLDFEECLGIGWVEYADIRRKIADAYNTEYLWIYTKEKIIKAFKREREKRNQRMYLEAKLSLNQVIGDFKEPVYTFLPSKKGDFAYTTCMWQDLRQMEIIEYKIMCGLYWGADDWEVIDWLKIATEEYFKIKSLVREKLREYMSEWIETEVDNE